MKLLVIINDSINAFRCYQANGHLPMLDRRALEVELTKDQAKQLKLSKDETYESISIIKNQKDES